jgi:hypothetical protein
MPRRHKATRLSTGGEVLLSQNNDQAERRRSQQQRRQSKGRNSVGLVQEHRRRSSGLQEGFTDELFSHCMQLLTKNVGHALCGTDVICRSCRRTQTRTRMLKRHL